MNELNSDKIDNPEDNTQENEEVENSSIKKRVIIGAGIVALLIAGCVGGNVAADLHDIGLLKESTDVSALVERSFKFFDGVPDSYTVSGDEFSDVVYESKSLSTAPETHVVNDCCG